MARKRTRKRRAPVRRKRRTYRNPSRRRRYAKKAVARARASLLGMNFRTAFKNMLPMQLGMFATKWAVKRFSDEYTASLGDPASWNWLSYLKGVGGAVAAGYITNMIKPGYGQKVFEGGINYLAFQLVQNKIIAENEWASGQFGADESDYYPDEYLDGASYDYKPGDTEIGPDGRQYLLGADLQWYPQQQNVGDVLQPVGPLGDVLEPVGPLGSTSVEDAYRNRILNA